MDPQRRRIHRRPLILKNLHRFIGNVEKGFAPVRIAEVLAFGSFIRGKAEPGDIDLVVFYRKDTELDHAAELFRLFVNTNDETEEGRKVIDAAVANPTKAKEAFAEILKGQEVPVDVWVRHILDRNRMSLSKYIFNVDETTRRVLKEGVRFMQVTHVSPIERRQEVLGSMVAKSYKTIWTETQRDLEKNLESTEGEQRKINMGEFGNFSHQLERLRAQYDLYVGVARRAIPVVRATSEPPSAEVLEHFYEEAASETKIKPKFVEWARDAAGRPFGGLALPESKRPKEGEAVTNVDLERIIATRTAQMETNAIGGECEAMRSEIRSLQGMCTVARALVGHITAKDTWHPYGRIPSAAIFAFRGATMREASDEARRRVLSDMGLEDVSRRIVQYGNRGDDYHYARSEKELKEDRRRVAQRKVGEEYSRYLRPYVRKFLPDSVECVVRVETGKEGMLPEEVDVEFYTGEEHVNSLKGLADRLGLEVEDSKYQASAELILDVKSLEGNRAAIRKALISRLASRGRASVWRA